MVSKGGDTMLQKSFIERCVDSVAKTAISNNKRHVARVTSLAPEYEIIAMSIYQVLTSNEFLEYITEETKSRMNR